MRARSPGGLPNPVHRTDSYAEHRPAMTRRASGGCVSPEGKPEFAKGGKLTAHERQSLPKGDFALPGKGRGPKGAGSGSYPIPDESHARNALARVSQHGSPAEKAEVRAKVHAKFPDIHESK